MSFHFRSAATVRVVAAALLATLLLASCSSAAGDPAPVAPASWTDAPVDGTTSLNTKIAAVDDTAAVVYYARAEGAEADIKHAGATTGSSETASVGADESWKSGEITTTASDLGTAAYNVTVTSHDIAGTVECAVQVDGKIVMHLRGTYTLMCSVVSDTGA